MRLVIDANVAIALAGGRLENLAGVREGICVVVYYNTSPYSSLRRFTP